MAKSEKNLWQRIKKLKLKGQIFRLERFFSDFAIKLLSQ